MFNNSNLNDIPHHTPTFKRQLQQIPSEENAHLAVCIISISNGHGTYEDFGIATPDMIAGSTNPAELINKASQEALFQLQEQQELLQNGQIAVHQQSAIASASQEAVPIQNTLPEAKRPIETYALPAHQGQHQVQIMQAHKQKAELSNTKDYNHNPNKRMSKKQAEALTVMAQERRVDLQNLAQQCVGKVVQDLSSADANTLMQHIRKI